MSFVKKAVKKVFKPVKSVVSKIPTPVLIAGAIFFTAGLATVGFGAFAGTSTLGGFLGAVGNTMAAGGYAMAGSLGIGTGIPGTATTGLAAATGVAPGTTLGTGVLAQSLGFGARAGSTASTFMGPGGVSGGGLVHNLPAAAAPTAKTSGILGSTSNALSGMSSTGKLMLAQGIMSGAEAVMQQRQFDKEQKRLERSNFFGGPMRGGTTDMPFRFPTFGGEGQQATQGLMPPMQDPSADPQTGGPGQLTGRVAQPIQQGIFAPGNLDLLNQDFA